MRKFTIFVSFKHCRTKQVVPSNTFPLGGPDFTSLVRIAYVGNNTLFASGDQGAILKTTNGGLNWTLANANIAKFSNHKITGLYFVNTTHGWAAGRDSTSAKNGRYCIIFVHSHFCRDLRTKALLVACQ